MKTALVALACVGGLTVAGCHKTGENAGKDLRNPEGSAVVNTAQDVASSQVGLASATTAGGFNTEAFVENAARGDLYEVQAGKIALERSHSPEVKKLAQMMIDDHTKTSDDLKSTISTAGMDVSPPTDLDQRRQGMIDNLKQSGDSDFDLAYLHQQLAAHLETLDLMKGFQNHGDNDALKTAAGKTATVVQQHLDMIRRIGGDKLKGG